ncbi:MAG: DUF2267 domain-containing protein [Chloroflexi bacterium]|nr:DUF2267 domain-containing protein [Chloroflexota bacterium]
MSTTGISSLDDTVHKTNIWLNEIAAELRSSDRHRAYLALRGVLHALRDRLTIEETAQFAAQLPLLVRGIYYEGWDPTGKPEKHRSRVDFLEGLQRSFRNDPGLDIEEMARAVLRVLERKVSEGEVEDVRLLLPKHIRALWPSGG